ncbi:rRNA methyltransferase 2, mitochondrial [Tachysurus fulvidraco]|uniref:rRNA methyltransferase 2, mitochondrial n=1 Tax=Tachysurus fulvidraco TaxID=1234273 RepID=UPI000F51589F|nr:rRNA methyltransferase 2, mitochondrial [Tachysurus fulvidraco]
MWTRVYMQTRVYTQTRGFHSSAQLLKKAPVRLKGKTGAEQRWLVRHVNDPFVKAAQLQHFRCRSAFKLLEVDEKHRLLKPGLTVIDCGAAPGAWSQVAVQRVNSSGERPDLPRGHVIGVDLLHIAPLQGAHFLSNHDITSPATHAELQELLPEAYADIILSDMAPNATGLRELDHERLVYMCLSLLELSEKLLRPGGSLLCKYWDGALAHKLREGLNRAFQDVKTVKPKASRKDSAELYFLARTFRKT